MVTAAKSQLQAVRKTLGYKQDQVVRMLLARAAARGVSIAIESALRTMLSRWENGHDQVTDPIYQALFRELYGRTNEELGFPADTPDETVSAFRDRILTARSIDAATVELLRQQVDNVRHIDRRLGAIPLLDQLNTQINQINDLLTFGTLRRHRESLAAVLAEAATLAGWQALDRGSLAQAWRHHETAKVAAREANSPALLAYATGQQAFILIDLGDPAGALELLDYAQSLHPTRIAELLRCWLAAAYGEGLAVNGNRDAALRAFDDAAASLPANPEDPDLPYLMLSPTHLARWRGHALTRLGDPAGIDESESALTSNAPTSLRATTGVLVDLAYAYSHAGDREAALDYSRRARQLASQIGSEREKRRLSELILPGTPRS